MSKTLIIDTSIIVALWGAQEKGAEMSPLRFLLDQGIVDKIVIPAQIVFELTHVLPANVSKFLREVEDDPQNAEAISRRYAQNNFPRHDQSGFMPANAEELLKFLARYATHGDGLVEVPTFPPCQQFQKKVEAELDTLSGMDTGQLGNHQLTLNEVLDALDIKVREMKNLHVPGWMLRDTGILADQGYKQNKDKPNIARLTLGRLEDAVKRKEKKNHTTPWNMEAIKQAIGTSKDGENARATLGLLSVFSDEHGTEEERKAQIKQTLKTHGRSWAFSIDDALSLGLLKKGQIKTAVKLLGYKKHKKNLENLDWGFREHILTVDDVKILANSGKFKCFAKLRDKLEGRDGEDRDGEGLLDQKKRKFENMVKNHLTYEDILLGAVADGFITLKDYLDIAVASGALNQGESKGDYITPDETVAVRLGKGSTPPILFQKRRHNDEFDQHEINDADIDVSSEVIKDTSRAMHDESLIGRAETASALSGILVHHWESGGSVQNVRKHAIERFEENAKARGEAPGTGKALLQQLEFNYYLSRWRWLVRGNKKTSAYDGATATADVLRKTKNNIGDYSILQAVSREVEQLKAAGDTDSKIIVAANDNEIKDSLTNCSLTDGHRINCLIASSEKVATQRALADCEEYVKNGNIAIANREDMRLTLAALALIHNTMGEQPHSIANGESSQSQHYDFITKLNAAKSVARTKRKQEDEHLELFDNPDNGFSEKGSPSPKENNFFVLKEKAMDALEHTGWKHSEKGWEPPSGRKEKVEVDTEIPTIWRDLVKKSQLVLDRDRIDQPF